MPTHEFTIALVGSVEITEALVHSLFDVGCDDATLSLRDGITRLRFAREAASFGEAVESAFGDIRKAGLTPGFWEAVESRDNKPQWLPEPPKWHDCYRGGYYYAIPKDRDTWLDGDIEVVFLSFNGKWSVLRVREMRGYAISDFSHWYGPITRPELPPEVEAMLDAD